jgi:hypothetical protein
LAVTVAPLVELSPPAFAHEYEDAPVAVRVPDVPAQIVIGETETAGNGLTVTTTTSVDTQPATLVAVTV